jgi:hypothetical protein
MQKAVTILYSDEPSATPERVLAVLAEAYVLYGVESWTLTDAKGKPVPFNPSTVRDHLMSDLEAAMTVADEADGLYAKVVLVPLLRKASTSSPPTPTTGTTSPSNGSQAEPRRKLSRRSSTSTTRTGATATTSRSRAGGSNSSQNSATAA